MKRWQIWLFNKKSLKRDFKHYLADKTIRRIIPNQRLVKIHLNKAFHNLDFANFTL